MMTSSLVVFLTSCCANLLQAATDAHNCGDYFEHTTDDMSMTFMLTPPGYPGTYYNMTHCIWLIEAPTGYAVQINVGEFRMHKGEDGGCADYLEIRDGNRIGNVLYLGCESDGFVRTSSNKWMWIRFRTDDIGTATAFTSAYTFEFTGEPYLTSPIETCLRFDIHCRNKECVSRSYRCDGMNDCGCDGDECDEHDCGGINWSLPLKVGIGVLFGSIIFVLLFLGICWLEIFLLKRAAAKSRREDEEQKKKRFKRPIKTLETNMTSITEVVSFAIPDEKPDSINIITLDA